VIKFCFKLEKTATEIFEILKYWKVRTVKNVYLEQVGLKGSKDSKKGESRYKTMNGKADCTSDAKGILIVILIYHHHKPIDSINLLGS
jgi:hypothetical protein